MLHRREKLERKLKDRGVESKEKIGGKKKRCGDPEQIKRALQILKKKMEEVLKRKTANRIFH